MSKKMEILETDSFIERVHVNGLVELVMKDSKTFDVKDMLAAKQFSTSIITDKKISLLVTFQGAFYPTKEARELLAKPDYSSHQNAIAVVTQNPGIQILGSLYLKVNKPKIPLKLFSKESDAFNWLCKYIT